MLILFSSTAFALTKTWDSQTQTVTIKNNAGTVNLTELQLLSLQSSLTRQVARFELRTHVSFDSNDLPDDYDWRGRFQVGNDISVRIYRESLVNVSYPNIISDCNPYGPVNNTILNCTYIQSGNYTVETLTLIPVNIKNFQVQANRRIYLQVIAERKAGLGLQSADIMPRLGGLDLQEFVWWNTSYNRRVNVTFDNFGGPRNPELVVFNLDHNRANTATCQGIDVANRTDDGALPFNVTIVNTTRCTVKILVNITDHYNGTVAVIYYDNSTAGIGGVKSRLDAFRLLDETFDDNNPYDNSSGYNWTNTSGTATCSGGNCVLNGVTNLGLVYDHFWNNVTINVSGIPGNEANKGLHLHVWSNSSGISVCDNVQVDDYPTNGLRFFGTCSESEVFNNSAASPIAYTQGAGNWYSWLWTMGDLDDRSARFFINGTNYNTIDSQSRWNGTIVFQSSHNSASVPLIDRVEVTPNLYYTSIQARITSSSVEVQNNAPEIRWVNLSMIDNGTSSVVIKLLINDTNNNIDTCFVGSLISRNTSSTECTLDIGDAIANSSIVIWVNDTFNLNVSRTVSFNLSTIRTQLNLSESSVTVGTSHNMTLRYNLTAGGVNVNETNIESNALFKYLGNVTNTTSGLFNLTFIGNGSRINEVNGTVLAINHSTTTVTCTPASVSGITRYTCRTYVTVRFADVDTKNSTFAVGTGNLTSWTSRISDTETERISNLSDSIDGTYSSTLFNINIRDTFTWSGGEFQIDMIYDIPQAGGGGEEGGGGGGGGGASPPALSVCGTYSIRPSQKIIGFGVVDTLIAPFFVDVINGPNISQSFSIQFSDNLEDRCITDPISTESIAPNGAARFKVSCTAPADKINGNIDVVSSTGCSTAIPAELSSGNDVLFGLTEFVRLMATGNIAEAFLVKVMFLPMFLWILFSIVGIGVIVKM